MKWYKAAAILSDMPENRKDQRTAAAVRRAHARRPRRRQPLTHAELRDAITEANAAADQAETARLKHRRRRRSDRGSDVAAAQARMRAAMVPLRSEAGRLARDRTLDALYGVDIRLASSRVRTERRKLAKLR